MIELFVMTGAFLLSLYLTFPSSKFRKDWFGTWFYQDCSASCVAGRGKTFIPSAGLYGTGLRAWWARPLCCSACRQLQAPRPSPQPLTYAHEKASSAGVVGKKKNFLPAIWPQAAFPLACRQQPAPPTPALPSLNFCGDPGSDSVRIPCPVPTDLLLEKLSVCHSSSPPPPLCQPRLTGFPQFVQRPAWAFLRQDSSICMPPSF